MISQAVIRARSWLFTPATRPDRFAKAAADGADVAILDLEDAVAPKDKAEARATALNYLAGNPSDGALHALRINGLDTLSGISDLDALLGSSAAPNFVVLPKTETAGHLQILDRLLTAAGKGHRAHRPDRERTWPCRSRGDRDRDAAADRPDAGRAYASKGGKSIIAATSTAAHGKISRIVPRLQGPVTTPRIDTHYIVTEFGSANLKGLSSTERAHALIGLAHPEFRDELLASAKKLHLV